MLMGLLQITLTKLYALRTCDQNLLGSCSMRLTVLPECVPSISGLILLQCRGPICFVFIGRIILNGLLSFSGVFNASKLSL